MYRWLDWLCPVVSSAHFRLSSIWSMEVFKADDNNANLINGWMKVFKTAFKSVLLFQPSPILSPVRPVCLCLQRCSPLLHENLYHLQHKSVKIFPAWPPPTCLSTLVGGLSTWQAGLCLHHAVMKNIQLHSRKGFVKVKLHHAVMKHFLWHCQKRLCLHPLVLEQAFLHLAAGNHLVVVVDSSGFSPVCWLWAFHRAIFWNKWMASLAYP